MLAGLFFAVPLELDIIFSEMPQTGTHFKLKTSKNASRQTGFTLVEVLTVMLVLVAMASITVEMSQDFVFQQRYEVTKDRYQKIRKAIVGDPNQVINGMPNIEGFVKDVGRLPFALQELLDGNFCSDTRYFTQADCEGAIPAQTWLATPNWQGSYIESTKAFDDDNALSDGWANVGDGNYGWEVSFKDSTGTPTTTIANAVSMKIQSKGKNGLINAADTDYDKDYPTNQQIEADWLISVDNRFNLNIITSIQGTCAAMTCSDPNYIGQLSCEKDNKAWNATDSVCQVNSSAMTNQATCEAFANFSWDGTNNYCIDTRYSTESSCNTTLRTWANHNAKNNCELSGITWTSDTSQICLKLQDENNNALAISTTPETLRLDSSNRQIAFASLSPNQLSQGEVFVALYEYDGSSCSTSTTAFGTTNPIAMMLLPNTTLPTINW